MHRRLFLFAVCATVCWFGCNRRLPLANAHGSADALGFAVLDALAHSDRTKLDELVLTEQEFRDHVWPDLPAARPERNLPFSYVWRDLKQKSAYSLAETLSTHAGQHYELIAIRFLGETTPYHTYRVHRKAELTVKSAAGATLPLRLFGSVLEKDRRFKIFSYVVD